MFKISSLLVRNCSIDTVSFAYCGSRREGARTRRPSSVSVAGLGAVEARGADCGRLKWCVGRRWQPRRRQGGAAARALVCGGGRGVGPGARPAVAGRAARAPAGGPLGRALVRRRRHGRAAPRAPADAVRGPGPPPRRADQPQEVSRHSDRDLPDTCPVSIRITVCYITLIVIVQYFTHICNINPT